jgi:precorrin-2 dehydrogenase/sirohydrochlorin ferrochelatase
VDEPDLCSFIFPSVLTKGDITIAISTNGKSPALNKYLKNKLDSLIGEEYSHMAGLMGKIRQKVIETIPDQKKRGPLFEAITMNVEVWKLIKLKEFAKAEKILMGIIDQEIERNRSSEEM